MKGYLADIETLTDENTAFRQVLYTGQNLQLVLMALKPGEDIGVHPWVLVLARRHAPDLVAAVAQRGDHAGQLDHLGAGADGDGEPQRRHRHPSKTSLK